jgi:uncharacterized protein (TIGR02246 family)
VKSRLQLESLTDSLMQAWNAHDAAALCALCAEDADFAGEGSTLLQGRKAIFEQYQEWFSTIFAHSFLAINAMKVRLLTPRSAIVHAVWSLRGHAFHSAHWLPVHTGTLLVVCKRKDARWELVFVHWTGAPTRAS